MLLLVSRASLGKPAWPQGTGQVVLCISSFWVCAGMASSGVRAALGCGTAAAVPSALCFAAQPEMLQGGGCWCASVRRSPGCGVGDTSNKGAGYAGRGQLEGRMSLGA